MNIFSQHKSVNHIRALGTKLLMGLAITVLAAQTTFAIGASPLRMEYKATPGETVQGQLTVHNTSDTPQKIVIKKSDFDMDENQENMKFLNGTDQDPSTYKEYPHGLQQWLTLPKEDIIINPQEKAIVPYEITVPEDAAAQGYYGALFVSSVPVSQDTQTSGIGMRLRTQVAHLVLLDVEGSLQDLSLKDFTIDEEDLNKPFDIVVYNNGNVHSSPEGTVEVMDIRGNTIKQVPLNEGHNNVLPQKTKTYFSESYVKEMPAGTYYAILDGRAKNGQLLQGKITFSVDRQGKVELIDKYIGEVDLTSLKGSAQQQYVVFQTVLAVIAVFIFAVAFLLIGRYCIVSSTAFGKRKHKHLRGWLAHFFKKK